MPDYVWVCHSCKQTNAPGTSSCQACGFPARASAADIEAVGAPERPPRQSRKEWEAARRADIAALPFWKKPAAYVLQLMRLVGAVAILGGVFQFSLRSLVLGFFVVIVAEIMFHLLKGRPYVWENS